MKSTFPLLLLLLTSAASATIGNLQTMVSGSGNTHRFSSLVYMADRTIRFDGWLCQQPGNGTQMALVAAGIFVNVVSQSCVKDAVFVGDFDPVPWSDVPWSPPPVVNP
jgi:hypothetical protein